jgi:hypothetical protein
MIKRSAFPKGVITKLLGDTKFVRTLAGCLKTQEVVTMNSSTAISVLPREKKVLFGRYVHNLYKGKYNKFYKKRKLCASKSNVQHNTQIGKYLTSAKKAQF